MNKTYLLSSILAVTAGLSSFQAGAFGTPKLTPVNFDEPSIYLYVSDNGKWAVTETRPEYNGGKVVNMEDFTYVTLTQNSDEGYGKPSDVTDDGNIAVGSFHGEPAYWTRSTGKWTKLSYDTSKYWSGNLSSVTADGHYAVGSVGSVNSIYQEYPAMWDLTTGEFIELPGLPETDMLGENNHQTRLRDISSDGRYITGTLSHSYQGMMSFIYDRQTQTYDLMCFEETPKGFEPTYPGAIFVSDIYMSPNGKYVAGSLYMLKEIEGSELADEFQLPYIYEIATKKFTVFDDSTDQSIMVAAVDNNGVIYGGGETIYGGPLRNFYIHSGSNWYELSQIMAQIYNVNIANISDLNISGTPCGISGDGKVITSFIDPNTGEGFALRMEDEWNDVCPQVNLMGTYSVTPAPGSALATAYEMTISFDRMIQLVGDASEIELLDENGEVVRNAMGATVAANRANITFRRTALDAGKVYTVHVPAGVLAMAKDATSVNRDIDIKYVGIANEPLAYSRVFPANNANVPYINANNYTIQMGFPAMLKLTDTAKAELYLTEDNAKVSDLNLSVSDNVLIISSVAEVPLLKGLEYKVVIAAGSVTDLSGSAATANEEIVLNYKGQYQRNSGNGPVLFSENFDNGLGTQVMFYEGDHNTPTRTMIGWGFLNGDQYPWWIARESTESYNYAAVSHSMYRPAGQSDDWMVLTRLFIPDANTRLTFKSQSYREAGDKLAVYVIPSDKVYGSLSDATIADFKQKRELVFNKEQHPGASEDLLEGDWVENEVDLGKYADRYIYIAFVNENNDCSAVFVDDIQVLHDMRFSVALDNEESVIAQKSAVISGTVYVQSTEANYDTAKLELLNADNELFDSIELNGLNVNSDNSLDFSFAKPMPLTVGEENVFVIRVTMHDKVSDKNETTSYERTIANLAFETTKRVVLEEYTGQNCGNCPNGIRAVEIMSDLFGEQFIPIVVRSYDNDPQTPANSDYARVISIEGLGAPSGVVNRKYAGYPMSTGEDGKLSYTGGSLEKGLWYDFVSAELSVKAPADIKAEAEYNSVDNVINVTPEITFAITSDMSLNTVAVLLENKVLCFQSNYFYNSTDPLLGEWGMGGSKGQQTVPVLYDHLARNSSNSNMVGTAGQLPTNFVAGEPVKDKLTITVPVKVATENVLSNCDVVVMLYDNISQNIINACKAPIKPAGIDNVIAADSDITIAAAGSTVNVKADGEIIAEVYDLSGRMIARAEGVDNADINLEGYNGVAIVRAQSAGATATAKVVIR